MPPGSRAALSYHEPDIVTILILSSFLLLENIINYAFDRLLFCGLIGQIAMGVAWGTPGSNILTEDVQNTIMQIGYLGLILLVYEGGLSTDLKTLKSNLFLSSLVALIGISAPIGLSFALRGFMDITPVQAFAAGAALCSTSLGTTFTILSSSGLSQSRLGVVLSSAAMMDDIVGLVMSGIISSLGQSSDFRAITVIRPVFVSIAFAVLVPLLCVWMIRPLTRLGLSTVANRRGSRLYSVLATEGAALIAHTLVLIVFVTGASYAGTSNLFAAYLAGAVVSWWDGILVVLRKQLDESGSSRTSGKKKAVPKEDGARNDACASQSTSPKTKSKAAQDDEPQKDTPSASREDQAASIQPTETGPSTGTSKNLQGTHIFGKYYSPTLQTILKPFFFASIGFSIPITRMFTGPVVWRGIVYTILMLIGKLICGLCLVRFSCKGFSVKALARMLPNSFISCMPWPVRTSHRKDKRPATVQPSTTPAESASAQASPPAQLSIPKPTSLYPAAILGSAMVARGEIGFLISSVAESNGVFGSSISGQSSELFLVVTWAILLCTLLGPITVGTMVRRVRRLQDEERSKKTGKADPLGIWGITPSDY